MKKQKYIFLAIVLVALMSSGTLMADGSAYIPHHYSRTASSTVFNLTQIWISNTSDATVTITVTFFDHTGTIITDSEGTSSGGTLKAGGSNNYNETTSDGSMTFDLYANDTVNVVIQDSTSTGKIGYGIIEWTSSTKPGQKKLIAYGSHQAYYKETDYRSFAYERAIPINNGEIF